MPSASPARPSRRPAAGFQQCRLLAMLVLLLASFTAHSAQLEQPEHVWELSIDSTSPLGGGSAHCIPADRATPWDTADTDSSSSSSSSSSSGMHAAMHSSEGVQRHSTAAQEVQSARLRRRQLRVTARRLATSAAAASAADAAMPAGNAAAVLTAGKRGVAFPTAAVVATANAAAGHEHNEMGAVRRMQLLARSAHDGLGEHSTPVDPADSSSSSSSSSSAGKAAAGNSVDDFQIALVNDVTFHHEVTLGFMAALQHHKANLKVYVRRELLRPGHSGFGFGTYVNGRLPGSSLRDAYYKEGIAPADVAIFLSPEFSVNYVKEFIARSRPRMVIMCIHEPRMQLRRLTYLLGLHKLVGIMTLSPHVASVLSQRLRGAHVHWMLPTLSARCNNSCHDGFAVQGKFESSRRNYHELWSSLEALSMQQQQQEQHQEQEQQSLTIGASNSQVEVAGAGMPRNVVPRVNVMGNGHLANLSLPAALRGHVHVYGNLSFGDYYDTICRSVALLPLFNASSGYLLDKISSTVLTSLITGVPMVVPPTFLEVYSQFKEQHVLVHPPLAHSTLSSDGHAASSNYADPDPATKTGRRPAFGIAHRKRRHRRAKAASLHTVEESSALGAGEAAVALQPTPWMQRGLLQQQQQQQQQRDTAEDVVDGMLQVLALPDEVLANKRKALARLRQVLNHQATAKLDGLMSAAAGRPHSGPKA